MLPKNLPLTPEEITRLIEATGWNKTEVGKMLGVVDTTVGRWMKGQAEPDPQNEAKLRDLRPHPDNKDEYAAYIRDAVARAGGGQVPSQPSAVPTFDPEALASALAQKLDADGIAQTVAGVVMATLPKVSVLARMVSMAVAGTISRIATGVAAQIAALREGLGQVVALLGRLKNELWQVAALIGVLKNELGQQVADVGVLAAKVLHGLDVLTAMLTHRLDALGAKVESLPRLDPDALARKLAQEVAARMPKPPEQTSNEKTLAAGVVRTLLPYLVGCTALIAIPLALLAFALFHMNGVQVERAQPAATNAPPASLALPAPATPSGARARVGRPVPKEPFKGQMRPPCGSFKAINGGCWLKGADDKDNFFRAPCPEDMYESASFCFVPMGERGERLPSSLDDDP